MGYDKSACGVTGFANIWRLRKPPCDGVSLYDACHQLAQTLCLIRHPGQHLFCFFPFTTSQTCNSKGTFCLPIRPFAINSWNATYLCSPPFLKLQELHVTIVFSLRSPSLPVPAACLQDMNSTFGFTLTCHATYFTPSVHFIYSLLSCY